MAKILRPKTPTDLNTVPVATLMRLRVNGDPATGMFVGLEGARILLYADKQGELHHSLARFLRIEFVDYLMQDESITIFGDAVEPTDQEDQIAFENVLPFIPENGFIDDVPDFVPFQQIVCDERLNSIMMPGSRGGRVSLSFQDRDERGWQPWGEVKPRDPGRKFIKYLDLNEWPLKRWADHPQIAKGVEVSKWPL